MPAISVIVPVYKVEAYLKKCLNSILSQSFTDYEIILVDDGSPDQCGKICDYFASEHSNIIAIHQSNGGLSAARNTGIDWAMAHSDSKWIVFIDSDDYIHKDYLKELYQAVTFYECDICMCNFLKVDETGSILGQDCQFPEGVFTDKGEFFRILYTNWRTIVAWNKIYRKTLFTSLRYDVGKIHEDEYIIHKLLAECAKIVYINKSLYYYVARGGSIINIEKELEHELIYLDIIIQRYWFCKRRHIAIDGNVTSPGYMHKIQKLGEGIPNDEKSRFRHLRREYKKIFLDAAPNKIKYRILFDFYPLYKKRNAKK